eukprot:scaffold245383_cov35-Tisochrysis_lutea.AAC.2
MDDEDCLNFFASQDRLRLRSFFAPASRDSKRSQHLKLSNNLDPDVRRKYGRALRAMTFFRRYNVHNAQRTVPGAAEPRVSSAPTSGADGAAAVGSAVTETVATGVADISEATTEGSVIAAVPQASGDERCMADTPLHAPLVLPLSSASPSAKPTERARSTGDMPCASRAVASAPERSSNSSVGRCLRAAA